MQIPGLQVCHLFTSVTSFSQANSKWLEILAGAAGLSEHPLDVFALYSIKTWRQTRGINEFLRL